MMAFLIFCKKKNPKKLIKNESSPSLKKNILYFNGGIGATFFLIVGEKCHKGLIKNQSSPFIVKKQ